MCKLCESGVVGGSLHVHTGASSDSPTPVGAQIDRAMEIGLSSMAITDHFEVSAFAEASNYVRSNNLNFKVIAGVETYLDISGSFDRKSVTHLTVLGDGNEGYNNIVKMQKAGSLRTVKRVSDQRFFARPPVFVQDILKHKEHLVILSGCPASVMADEGYDLSQMREFYRLFSAEFKDRFYVEYTLDGAVIEIKNKIGNVVKVSTPESRAQLAIMFASEFGLPLVVTDDAHFARPEEAPVHTFYTNRVLGFNYYNEHVYQKSAHGKFEFIQNLKLSEAEKAILVQGIIETEKLSNKLRGIDFGGKLIMPDFDFDFNIEEVIEAEFERHFHDITQDKLDLSAFEGTVDDYKLASRARLNREMDVINSMGYLGYFSVVYDMHEFVERIGYKKPYGRGSAGGSFVCFLLGIVKLNPILRGLFFERFLNHLRMSAIDIDADFGSTSRELVIDYIQERYGAVPIATHIRYGHDSLINEFGRDEFLKLKPSDLKELKKDEVRFRDTEVWKRLRRREPNIDLIYDKLLGAIRNNSVHAGGLIIESGTEPLEMPVTVNKRGEVICSVVEGGYGTFVSEELQRNKYDVLSNQAVEHVDRLEKHTGVKAPNFQLHERFPDDMVEAFKSSKNLDGVFQIGGGAVRDYVPLYGVTTPQHIMDISAIRRKGAILAGTDQAILKHRPISGLPKRRSNGNVKPDGALLELVLDTGKAFKIHENWQVATVNRGWVAVKDLTNDDELVIED